MADTGPAPGMDDAAKKAADLREQLQEVLFASRDIAQEATVIAKALGLGSIEASNFRKAFKDTADVSKRLADNTDDILSGLKDSKDVQKDILKNENSRKSLQTEITQQLLKEGFGQTEINKALVQKDGLTKLIMNHHRSISSEVEAAATFAEEQLDINKENEKVLQKQLAASKNIDKASGLTGGTLKAINKLTGGHVKGLDEALQTSRKEIAELQRKGKLMKGFAGQMQGLGIQMKNVGKAVLKSFTDPVVVITTIAKTLGSLDKLLTNNQKILNQTTAGSREYYQEMQNVANASDNINVTYKSLIESQLALTKHLGIANNFSDQMKEDFIVLTKQAKISEEGAAGLAKQSLISGQELGKASDNAALTGVNILRAKGINVSFQKILEQTAKVTGQVAVNLGNNPEKIAAAVAQATALGTTLDGVNKIAMSLLDFEGSIEKEMEAELLIGRELNLERARALALTGSQEELAAELVDQVGSYSDFADMNVIQQQKLAAAMGMSSDEMSNMLMQQEMQGKSAEDLRAMGKDELADMKLKQDAQEKFAAAIEKLKGMFVDLMDVLMPLVDIFVAVLVPAIDTMGILLAPIFDMFNGISGILSGSVESLSTMEMIMGTIGILAAAYLATTKTIALFEGIIATRKANQKVMDVASLYLEESKKKGILSTIGALTLQLGIKMGILSAELASNAALTFGIGVAIAVAAATAGYYAIKALTADDMMSPATGGSGYGSRTLFGPEGAIALNNKDTVIAGTNLFDKGDDVISTGAGSLKMPTPQPQPLNITVESNATMDLFPSAQSVASVQVPPIVP